MKKHVWFLALFFSAMAAKAQYLTEASSTAEIETQKALVFKSVTVDGLKKEDTKRLIRNGLPVCGYYSDSDSLFYSCSLDNPVKVKDRSSLKDGAGCCGSITFGRVDAMMRQDFSITGTLENTDSAKGQIKLKNGGLTYSIELANPASMKVLAPAIANHPDQLTIHLKNMFHF